MTIDDPGWRRLIRHPETWVMRAAALACRPVDIVLTNDRTVRQLNARHRGRNKSTNVLTFEPAGPTASGEIFLALGTIRREAASARRSPAAHLAHLVLHGLLHLAGEDHAEAGQARHMEMTEARLLSRLRVSNPWRAR